MNYSYHLNLNRFYLKRKMLEIHLLAKFSVLPFGEYFINIEWIKEWMLSEQKKERHRGENRGLLFGNRKLLTSTSI